MSTASKRNGLLIVGVVVLLAGVVAAAGLWFAGGQREANAIEGLARAPQGCDTTLDFEAAGEFLLFVETEGALGDVSGDCGPETDYSWTGASLPAPIVRLVDPDGTEVELDSSTGTTYSGSGFTGQSIRSFTVDAVGDHVLTVESRAGNGGFAVAVGRDPESGVETWRLGAAAALITGLIGGGLLIVFGARSKPTPAPDAASGTWPTGPQGWPSTPPGMPQAPAPSGWQPAVGPPSTLPNPPATQSGGVAPPGWAGVPWTTFAPADTATAATAATGFRASRVAKRDLSDSATRRTHR